MATDQKDYLKIKSAYASSAGDSTALFETILQIAAQTGLDPALALLERCVIEKRLLWFEKVGRGMTRTGDSLQDGYRLFYQEYLGVYIPAHGDLVEATPTRMVTRWRNTCPTLAACQKLGLDTRVVCRQVYHRPVQALLSRLDPRLKFERNYASIRPHTPYCEEVIELVDR